MRYLTAPLAALGLACLIGGCERETPVNTRPAPATNSARPDATRAADNTAQNAPDRNMDATTTPEDQSNADTDVELTAAIRRALMDDGTLSTNAKNVKIIADKTGTVTLRGVVESQAEKDTVESKAKAVAGVKEIKNLIDVKAP